MSKVLVTIDFDGAVSPIDDTKDFSADGEFELFRLGAFDCAISKSTLDFLGELHELSLDHPEKLKLIWATSWESMTEHFSEDTGGRLPELGYLSLDRGKAEAIAEAVLQEDASMVIVFEDHPAVHEDLRGLWSGDSRFRGRTLISICPKLERGIELSHRLETQSFIMAELGKES